MSWKRALSVAKALHRLSGHHSRPQYSVSATVERAYRLLYGSHQMTWGKWDGWGKGKARSPPQNAKKDKEKQEKREKEKQNKFPAYDAVGKGGGSVQSSSSSAALATPEMVELLKTLVAKDQSLAPQVEGLIPDPLKEEIQMRQREINQIRKLQQKVERKEAAILKKESQMAAFQEEIKQHVLQEKTRHKTEMDVLKKELEEAKEALQNAKEGRVTIEEDPATELEMMFQDEDEMAKENQELKKQLAALEQQKNQQQAQMYQMQSQMEAFMRQYSDNVKLAAVTAVEPNMPVEPVSGQAGMNLGKTPESPIRTGAAALQPFRVPREKQNRASPYGEGGGKKELKDGSGINNME